jgi:hypothetical protein
MTGSTAYLTLLPNPFNVAYRLDLWSTRIFPKENFKDVTPGDLGGHSVYPQCPIYFSGKILSRRSLISQLKQGDASSSWINSELRSTTSLQCSVFSGNIWLNLWNLCLYLQPMQFICQHFSAYLHEAHKIKWISPQKLMNEFQWNFVLRSALKNVRCF